MVIYAIVFIYIFFVKNRRICNCLRIKRLFGLHGNWVTRWQPFLFQSSLLFCINDITPDTQRYNNADKADNLACLHGDLLLGRI